MIDVFVEETGSPTFHLLHVSYLCRLVKHIDRVGTFGCHLPNMVASTLTFSASQPPSLSQAINAICSIERPLRFLRLRTADQFPVLDQHLENTGRSSGFLFLGVPSCVEGEYPSTISDAIISHAAC